FRQSRLSLMQPCLMLQMPRLLSLRTQQLAISGRQPQQLTASPVRRDRTEKQAEQKIADGKDHNLGLRTIAALQLDALRLLDECAIQSPNIIDDAFAVTGGNQVLNGLATPSHCNAGFSELSPTDVVGANEF